MRQWDALTQLLGNGSIPIDNNRNREIVDGASSWTPQLDVPGQRLRRQPGGVKVGIANSRRSIGVAGRSFTSLPHRQTTSAIFGWQFGQVVTLSAFSRSDHSCPVGFDPPSLLLSRPDGP